MEAFERFVALALEDEGLVVSGAVKLFLIADGVVEHGSLLDSPMSAPLLILDGGFASLIH